MNTYHKAVLVREVVEHLAIKPGGIYIDATFGGGGHTRAILEADNACKVISLDWDQKAFEINALPLKLEFGDRFDYIWGNFADIEKLLKKNAIGKVDGILADFGTSQYQIHERPGFSFAKDTPLDMRMSPAHYITTAYEVVNKADEKLLSTIFYEYGDERKSFAIARRIVEVRSKKPIKTTGELAAVVESVIRGRPGGIHPATRVFQALRMYVNDELGNIKAFLAGSLHVLKESGRLVCISFHSHEDRIVKNFFKEHQENVEILTPKVVIANQEEIRINRSARSAKLRAVQLIKLFD